MGFRTVEKRFEVDSWEREDSHVLVGYMPWD